MLTFEGPFEWNFILAETPGGKVGYMVRDEETYHQNVFQCGVDAGWMIYVASNVKSRSTHEFGLR